jgi:hypothetical protein
MVVRLTKRDLRAIAGRDEVLREITRPSGRMKVKSFDNLLLGFLAGRGIDELGEDYPNTTAYLSEFGMPK